MNHHLKINPEYFKAIVSGIKTFEVRKNDRDFKINDIICLHEYCPNERDYTGESRNRKISYIIKGGAFGIDSNYVIIGFKTPVSITEEEQRKFIEYTYDMNLQNLSPRLTENRAFEEGIEVGICDLIEWMNDQ